MTRTLSANLTTEMDSLERDVRGGLMAELWLPSWTAQISGLSGGETEEYAHGHAVAVGVDANGAGEDIIFRARSGSYASPQNGHLYIAIIKDSDLDDPSTWDGLWIDTGVTGVMYPAWTSNSGAAYGGSIAVVAWNNGGTWTGRVFYIIASTGALQYRDYNLSTGAAIGGATTIVTLGTGTQLASMQIGACTYDEVFVLYTSQVEASQAAWQKAIYGTLVRRYAYSGGWSLDGYTFPYHTIMEGHAVKDDLDYDAASTSTVTQWGKRPCGGLAVHEIDANTVVVSFGAIQWRRRSYFTHNAAIRSFIYHRDSGWWEPGGEIDRADFIDGQRLKLPMFARNSVAGGNNILVWSRLVEPVDFEQDDSAPVIARLREVVWARLSADGKHFSQFERLGDQDELTAAGIIQVQHSSAIKLYAVGWRTVLESEEAAAVVDSVASPLDLADYATGWNLAINNRMNMTIDMDIFDPTPVHDGNLDEGMLVRANFGNDNEQVQAAQAFVDRINPDISMVKSGDGWMKAEKATLNARADYWLQDTRAEAIGDQLAHTQISIAPSSPIKHVSASKGVWKVAAMNWPGEFFSSAYASLDGEACYRLFSFPFAATGGDILQEFKGTWFKDITWLGLPPRVEGSIEASVRFGDDYNISNFTVPTSPTLTANITRSNGVITQIQWTATGYSNTVKQYAVMAGLICHAPETGRKYSFIWEHQSDFSTSSHTDDTWTAENFDRANYSATGSNRLYLLVSDYDGDNWVHRDVATISATGLTPGKPADLKIQVIGGTVYCYYRAHATDAQLAAGTQPQWKFAFSHKSGRFGASQFGIVGRGHGGIMWQAIKSGEQQIRNTINYVDFWNIKLSDGVVDRSMEEHLARHCWRAKTATDFNSRVDEATRTVNSGNIYNYDDPAINPTITFKVDIPSATNEAGVFLRGVDNVTPTDDCIKIGIVAHSTSNAAATDIYYYVVKRRFASGSEVLSAREYSPIPIKFEPGLPVPVRVSVRGSVYAIWVAGNYAGHFIDSTALGLYYGLYATGGNADFSDIYMPELYEVPIYAAVQVGQSIAEVLRRTLGSRRIKAIFQYDGSVKFSYFLSHDTGPDFEDSLKQVGYRTNGQFYSVVRVDGAFSWAEYASAVMLAQGRKFKAVHLPDIFHYEHCYQEAKAIAYELAERQFEADFEGLPDLRLQPEDSIGITQADQSIAGDFLVDDVKLSYKLKTKEAKMSTGVRSLVVL